jgi:hypothetical protein
MCSSGFPISAKAKQDAERNPKRHKIIFRVEILAPLRRYGQARFLSEFTG